MKFPSIRSVFTGAFRAFLRFPLAILLAVTGTAFCIGYAHLSVWGKDGHFWFWNVVAAAYLGMLLSIALTVLAESRQLKGSSRVALQGSALLLAVGYYLSLPGDYSTESLIRFILIALSLHWLIACIAFVGWGKGGRRVTGGGGSLGEGGRRVTGAGGSLGEGGLLQDNGFWVYNKQLFLRILTSVLYSWVLFVGLVIALSAIEHLFHVDVEDKVYFDMWFVMIGVFNTWFFLADFPEGYERPKAIDEYPRGLKVFTQFVLMPILTIYLLILYAYMIRIAVTAVWPYGWVSYMVLAFSVAGILAILLVWPLRNEEDNKWIRGYSRVFYFALFPLIVLLAFAIWKRVSAYGITELRYFVLLLASWLLLTALYFLVSKKKTIRLIPLSLCIVAFLSAFGPWGAEGVSLYSQRARLKGLLEKDQLLVDGKAGDGRLADGKVGDGRLADGKVGDGKAAGRSVRMSLGDRQEISDLTEYIVRMHGYRALQPLFNKNIDTLLAQAPSSFYAGMGDHRTARLLLKEMKVDYAGKYETEDDLAEDFYADMERPAEEVIVTTGYDYLVSDIYFNIGRQQVNIDTSHYQLGKYQLLVRLDTATNQLRLFPDKDSALTIDLSGVLNEIPSHNEGQTVHMPKDKMFIETGNSQWGCYLSIARCNGDVHKGDKKVIRSLSGYLLMKRK